MTDHKQAAREIVQQVCDAIREKARQTDWTSESSSDESLSSVWYEHISSALARVERETRERTIEECAGVCDLREADGRDAEESAKKAGVPGAAFSYGTRGIEAKRCAAAIRALSGGSK